MINNEEICGPIELSDSGKKLSRFISKNWRTKLLLSNWRGGTAANWHSNFLGKHLKELIKDPVLKDTLSNFTNNKKYKIWRSNIFYKRPGFPYKGINWHHDKHFQENDRDIDFREIGTHISLLIAISNIDKQTGIFRYIPGSVKSSEIKRNISPSHLKSKKDHFKPIIEDFDYDKNSKSLEIKDGNFIVFHSALIHGSAAATSIEKGRMGIVLRLIKRDKKVSDKLLKGSPCLDI